MSNFLQSPDIRHIQRDVFTIARFIVNPLLMKIAITPEPVTILA